MDVKYPILNLHIALPDFSSGAMENWGLQLTVKSTFLLMRIRPLKAVKQCLSGGSRVGSPMARKPRDHEMVG